jgi:hypothetical protein
MKDYRYLGIITTSAGLVLRTQRYSTTLLQQFVESMLLSDSFSRLQCIRNRGIKHPVIKEICCMYVYEAPSCRSRVLPALPVTRQPILTNCDKHPLFSVHVLNQKQSSWSLETQNTPLAIEPTVNISKSVRLLRQNETIVNRIEIGYSL